MPRHTFSRYSFHSNVAGRILPLEKGHQSFPMKASSTKEGKNAVHLSEVSEAQIFFFSFVAVGNHL